VFSHLKKIIASVVISTIFCLLGPTIGFEWATSWIVFIVVALYFLMMFNLRVELFDERSVGADAGHYGYCDCNKTITQRGEFRCYDCWEVDNKESFGE